MLLTINSCLVRSLETSNLPLVQCHFQTAKQPYISVALHAEEA